MASFWYRLCPTKAGDSSLEQGFEYRDRSKAILSSAGNAPAGTLPMLRCAAAPPELLRYPSEPRELLNLRAGGAGSGCVDAVKALSRAGLQDHECRGVHE